MRLRFLGTGASGGTPGEGRSRRTESSLLIADGETLLIDVTRDFGIQAPGLDAIDAVLLTHGHRDACGGLPQLRRWWLAHGSRPPIDVFLSRATATILRDRYARLDHCRLRIVQPRETQRAAGRMVTALRVPHAHDPRFETYAWRVSDGSRSLVYASDVARLTGELRRFCEGADVLVLDGAMWHRPLFSHLTINQAVPHVCRWPVGSIILTQIGRTVPPHPLLERELAALCPRATPAYDGLELVI